MNDAPDTPPMTLDELIERARYLISANKYAFVEPETIEMARAIVALLDRPSECGWPLPTVSADGMVRWESLGDGVELTADEAVTLGVELARAGLAVRRG